MNRRAVLFILICLSIKGVDTDQESFDHRLPYKPAIQNFSSLSSSKMSSNGTFNDNFITCKQPVRPRQEGLQCDGCQKCNHRTCNTGMSLFRLGETLKHTQIEFANFLLLWGAWVYSWVDVTNCFACMFINLWHQPRNRPRHLASSVIAPNISNSVNQSNFFPFFSGARVGSDRGIW